MNLEHTSTRTGWGRFACLFAFRFVCFHVSVSRREAPPATRASRGASRVMSMCKRTWSVRETRTNYQQSGFEQGDECAEEDRDCAGGMDKRKKSRGQRAMTVR